MSHAAVDIRDVFRVFSTPEGDAAALQGLSLIVQPREVVTVLGPSGSGKTSLLRLLAGLDRPSSGSIRVFDLDLGRLPARELGKYRKTMLGYVDQHYWRMLASELSARELVGLPLGLRGLPRRVMRSRADELLDRVGLLDRRDAHPSELSGGEQQRIAVCAGLVHRPRLFLADEPTGELDGENARLVFGLIGELAREHAVATVIVSHDPRSAAVADRIVQIRDGRVAEEAVREQDGGGASIVVNRGGWLRLPEDYLRRAGIGSRASARVEERKVVLLPPDATPQPVPTPAEPGPEPAPASPDGVVAEVISLAKTYGGATRVFDDLNARFQGGTFHAVTGPSGSGKTTLLHLLAGLELPSAGKVVVDGRSISELDRDARALLRSERIGLVAQQPGLIPFLSACENVELALAVNGAAPGKIAETSLEVLRAVGLGGRVHQRVSRLSTGERGRVAIARALARRPTLLVADEPTARLDQANALAVATLLVRLARETGAAVVCATHDPLVIEQADEQIALSAS